MKPTPIAPDYTSFLTEVKGRIQTARLQAGRAVNRELVMLYWDIGRGIVEKQQVAGWGDSVVERLAADLRAEFPGMRGFSADNVWRMRQFYADHSTPAFLEQAVPELKRCMGMAFLEQAVPESGGSTALSIPGQAVPETLSQAVRELVSRIPWGHHVELMKKLELEERLISRLQQFILELGYGFCFVGRQYRLALGKKEYFVDLLFYHRFLQALVAFDLKIAEFEPEHAGKMDFYLNLLNEKERGPDDRPSIGIILCAEKDDVEVEFALKTKTNPIGVAEYVLSEKLPSEFKGKLPTARQLADVAREFLPAPKATARKKKS